MAFRPDSHRSRTLERRDAVLDAAIGLVADGGLGAVTHRAVAAKAGLPAATTSYFFASIDELLTAAMRRVTDTIVTQMRQVAERLATADPRPQAALDQFVAVLLAEPGASTVAQFETYLHASRRPELRPDVQRALTAFNELVGSLLKATGSPPGAAPAFVALADGFMLHRIAVGRSDNDARTLREAFHALLRGYRPPARPAKK